MPIVAGVKRKYLEMEHESESEDEDTKRARKEEQDHRAKMAAITARYCTTTPDAKERRKDLDDDSNRPDRMRLG